MKTCQSILLVLVIAALGLPHAWAEQGGGPIVVMLEKTAKKSTSKSVWKIDGKELNGGDFMLVLDKLIVERGRNWPVVVLFQSNVPLSEVGNITGIVGKVGFDKVKYYLFDDAKTLMTEVVTSKKSIPFSEKGEGVVFDSPNP